MDFEQELDASFKNIDEGDIFTGTVVSVDETGVVLDLKYYTEGFIPAEEFSREQGFNMKELRSRVGLVFQYPEHQLFETTVFKDVCFGPKNLGLDKRECELRAFEALELVGMDKELFYNSPFELSGGLKRRAAIARLIAKKPEVLILDAPTA